MLIYRVERLGLGPYYKRPIENMLWAHDSPKTHPTPYEERIADLPDFRCGSITLDHLKIWFKGWRNKLRMAGFRLKVYEIPHKYVRIGDKQLIFDKDFAKEIADLPIP